MFVYHCDPTTESISSPAFPAVDIHRVGSGFWFHLYSTIAIELAVQVLESVLRGFTLLIGLLWTGLTVAFEFPVGYVEGTPVSVTLGQYNVLAGQVWIAVPVALLISPLLFGWYLST